MARIDPESLDRNYGEATYHLGVFMMNYLRRLHAQFDGDLALVIVLGEIGQHSARRIFREALPASGKDSRTLLTDEFVAANLRRCNMLSVAEASGIPRETVRRKVDKLIRMGFVSRAEDGTLAITRMVGTHFREFDRQAMQEVLELAERLHGMLAGR